MVPDGNTLAFVRTSGRTDAIWLDALDGGKQRRLTDPPQLGTDYARLDAGVVSGRRNARVRAPLPGA